MEQHFKLYTWQLPSWDIAKEARDPSKCVLRWKDIWPRLQPLYEKLANKAGTADFVWCFSAYEHWKQPEISKLWVLDVPTSKIFKFIDSNVWGMMVQDSEDNKQPEDSSWDNLIMARSDGINRLSAGNNDITPLVLVPICKSIRVIDKSRFNMGPSHSSAKYEDLPTSECEAKRYRGEVYNDNKRQRRKGLNLLKHKRLD